MTRGSVQSPRSAWRLQARRAPFTCHESRPASASVNCALCVMTRRKIVAARQSAERQVSPRFGPRRRGNGEKSSPCGGKEENRVAEIRGPHVLSLLAAVYRGPVARGPGAAPSAARSGFWGSGWAHPDTTRRDTLRCLLTASERSHAPTDLSLCRSKGASITKFTRLLARVLACRRASDDRRALQ